MKTSALLAIVIGGSVAGGCASSSAVVDEGLQTRNPELEIRLAGADARIPAFERIALAPFELEFRPADPMTGPTGSSQLRTVFPVPAQDQQRIAELFNEIFRDELGGSEHFSLTGEHAPGVLLIRPTLRDIVSHVPPEEPPGRSRVFLDRVGEATLVVEFADAVSGKTIGTAMDRGRAEPVGAGGSGFGAVRATDVTTGYELRRLARRWAMALESRVEQLYLAARAPSAPAPAACEQAERGGHEPGCAR